MFTISGKCTLYCLPLVWNGIVFTTCTCSPLMHFCSWRKPEGKGDVDWGRFARDENSYIIIFHRYHVTVGRFVPGFYSVLMSTLPLLSCSAVCFVQLTFTASFPCPASTPCPPVTTAIWMLIVIATASQSVLAAMPWSSLALYVCVQWNISMVSSPALYVCVECF